MKNKKNQDTIVYGSIAAFGLAVIYVLFFTDIVFGSDNAQATTVIAAESNFGNINIKVKSEPVKEYDSKLELYDEELRGEEEERKQVEMKANLERDEKPRQHINDLTKFLEKEQALEKTNPEPQVAQDKDEQRPVPLKKKSAKKKIEETVVAEPAEAPQVEKIKRPRRADPAFGDGSTQSESQQRAETLSAASYSAVIQGEQLIKDGGRVTVRITQDITVGSCALSANSRLTGLASISGQRIMIRFTACQKENSPIQLNLYDVTDGNEGLYVESLNTGQELKKEAVTDAVGETADQLGVPILDKVVRSAGSKKLESPAVTLQSGTEVILKVVAR